jgi:hypothetical protein
MFYVICGAETSGCGDVMRNMRQACLASLYSNVGRNRGAALYYFF